ncbi:MAG: BamA/TamA family outer membrane protein [Methanoregula sp.]
MKKQIILLIFCATLVGSVFAQSEKRTGWGWGGVPAVNYNADEGFGYGLILDLFNYSKGGKSPYYFKINNQLFFTTGGKQDHAIFFDSPYILGKGMRITGRIRYKKENYFPYYGLGNDSKFNTAYIETDDNGNSLDTLHGKHYYTLNNEQIIFYTNVQKALKYRKDGRPLISALGGLGFYQTESAKNTNEGLPTKYQEDIDSGILTKRDTENSFNEFIKLGIVYDSRDNEPAPNTGVWTDLLAEWYTGLIGRDNQCLRLTFTDRRYFQIANKFVYANRILLENIFGEAPFQLYYPMGSSFRIDEGVGGYRSIRGVYKNRYAGSAKFLMNMELRYRFYDFHFGKQDFYLAANAFYDFGRVWHDRDIEGGLKNLHSGEGLGLHIGWNENFIVYSEMAFSKEAGEQLYIDIGYLF